MKFSILLTLIIYFNNCNSKSVTKLDSIQNKFSLIDSVVKLVKTSSYKAIGEISYIQIDTKTCNNILIAIFTKGSENTDIITGWLKLDFRKMNLEDITIDPDKPLKLIYNKKLLGVIKQEIKVGLKCE